MSNLIKSASYVSIEDIRTIEALKLKLAPKKPVQANEHDESSAKAVEELGRLEEIKQQILQDAESAGEQILHDAMNQAELLKCQAEEDIRIWWEERRQADEQTLAELREQGYQDGYHHGVHQAEAQVQEEYGSLLEEARRTLEQAHFLKERIIQESEPFIVELSVAIAEKIIGKQLTLSKEWTVELIKKALERRREKGIITLCVAPQHFAYIQAARDELVLSVDSQAELQILPDATVADHGCVIRSAFGSIDARIDTQLNEVKKALQDVALRSGDESDDE